MSLIYVTYANVKNVFETNSMLKRKMLNLLATKWAETEPNTSNFLINCRI